ncbi:MAG TPA: VCBS repeat-containing protein [Baekduia sp.]|jgi:hypothetical protein
MHVPHRRRARSRATVAALLAATSVSALAAGSAQATVNLDHGVRVNLPGMTGAGPVAIADFDGDGYRDVVVGGTDSLEVLLHQSDGSYQVNAYSGLPAIKDLVVGNFDGDAIPDVAALLSNGNVDVFAGQHGVDHQPLRPAPLAVATTGYTGGDVQRIAAGDIDGDGVDDLVASGAQRDTITTLTNGGDGTSFTASAPIADTADTWPTGIALADLNGDGKLDVVTANAGNTQRNVSVYLNAGGSTPYSAHTETATSVNGPGYEIATGDFVGDAATDVVITSFNAGFSVLEGDGTGALAAGRAATNGATNQGLAIADFDGDGTTDFATWDRSGGNPRYLYFRSLQRDGIWPTPGFLNGAQAPDPINGSGLYEDYPVAADMDNDGHPDIVMADSADHSLAIMSQDVIAPDSVIASGPSGTTSDTSVTFTYDVAAPETYPAAFECRLTGPGQSAGWEACGQSPGPVNFRQQDYTDLADGDYTFELRATDYTGNVEQAPASRAFTVDTTPDDAGSGSDDSGDGHPGGSGDAGQGDQGAHTAPATNPAPGPAPAPAPATPAPTDPRATKAPATPARLALTGLRATLPVTAGGTVTVPVAGAANGRGHLLIRTAKAFRIKNGVRSRSDRRHRIARITLAKRDFVVDASGRISLKVKLVGQYRQALRGTKQVKATITVTAGGKAVTRRVTLVLPQG